ncbi:amino acid ABC transporter permease [Brucella sp. ZJ1_1]|uniref:Amino acid ABC transporter, permease protein, 3-TM region, His/Glu/Gln/Arg/opine family n=3 Tax=Brucella intermedia TaxID=94625 RepID=C4WPR5_9HYPH|nr:amino acid ABC transporter permease [Brucella intermedia]PJT24896.1 amino acid ABC transporter permease [Ochrobactrum sp. 30A/1000/2015]PJT40346.1 amino acid ABC transporter permease [Ochrobactrum sp. 27A/999/2015]PJT43020.1 amino acid ABC transporter permease [Ochrobactrum sp. 23A/997/2015]EEQ94258.1 amino acid ABC transporter, permease protein, 3-TM region, His/Glu/Gln/Arg/opine family [Brucella intermedia LMG 3301]ELT50496.1 polar amino acid ABC transporter inner membrane subunit [Brucel
MIRSFGFSEFLFILDGAKWTVILSLLAFTFGGMGGLVVALGRTSAKRWLRYLMATYIQIFQGTPLLIQLFFVYFGLPILGIRVDIWVALIIGLSLHASAFLGEIWRGSIQAVSTGQDEAARALGIGYFHRMKDVVLPQAFRIGLPATIGFLVNLIKGTALAALLGLTELTRSGQLMANITFEPMKVYGTVGLIYFIICVPLTYYSARIEKRLNATR